MPRRALRLAGMGLLLVGLFALGLYATMTGPRGLDAYPPAAESPYRLPWPAGETFFCIQGNRAVVSHRGWEEHAYDFLMPVGSPVIAARGGKVIQVVQHHDGNGYKRPNNRVTLRHDDGTLGHYLHIKKDGARVAVGDRVEQGAHLADSGNVGNSMMPHLHFHVTDADRKRALPTTFADVAEDQGIPRMGAWYTSGNAAGL